MGNPCSDRQQGCWSFGTALEHVQIAQGRTTHNQPVIHLYRGKRSTKTAGISELIGLVAVHGATASSTTIIPRIISTRASVFMAARTRWRTN